MTSIYVDARLPKIIENTNLFDAQYGRPTEQRTLPRYYVIAYLGCTLMLLTCACIDILINEISVNVIYESILRYDRVNIFNGKEYDNCIRYHHHFDPIRT